MLVCFWKQTYRRRVSQTDSVFRSILAVHCEIIKGQSIGLEAGMSGTSSPLRLHLHCRS